MIKIENYEVLGWEHAIRGMRNPKNSWEKSDSVFYKGMCDTPYDILGRMKNPDKNSVHFDYVALGPEDAQLMMNLRNAGTDHRKFMRMITVYVDITAPLYWWKEFDTYKVGTVANSCSTMHKIHAKEFTLDDFSREHLNLDSEEMLEKIIKGLNAYREDFRREKDKDHWWQLIQMLPSSYNQKRTVMLNYEVLANMYKSRKNHKLDEWLDLCKWIEELPYSELITGKAVNDADSVGAGKEKTDE